MASELLDGVYALELEADSPAGAGTLHPAAVETPRGLLLVDAGLPGQLDQLSAELSSVGRDLDDAWGVVFTHQDPDHAGGGSDLRAATDVVAFAHTEDAPAIAGDAHPIKADPDERFPPVGVDVEVVDGAAFATLAGPMRIVHTPGHTPGHVALFLPDAGLLLAADAVFADDGDLTLPPERLTPDLQRAAESVGRLADLPVADVLCYHGGHVVVEDGDLAALGDTA